MSFESEFLESSRHGTIRTRVSPLSAQWPLCLFVGGMQRSKSWPIEPTRQKRRKSSRTLWRRQAGTKTACGSKTRVTGPSPWNTERSRLSSPKNRRSFLAHISKTWQSFDFTPAYLACAHEVATHSKLRTNALWRQDSRLHAATLVQQHSIKHTQHMVAARPACNAFS